MEQSRTSSAKSAAPCLEATTPSSSGWSWVGMRLTGGRSSIIEEATPASAADAHRRSYSRPRSIRDRLRCRQHSGALAHHPAALSLGTHAGRRSRGDGSLATVRRRHHQVSRVVGVQDDGKPRCRRNPLSARAGYHARHGCCLASGPRCRCHRNRDRAHMGRPALAAGRTVGGKPGHRSHFHPWDRFENARGNQSRGGREYGVNSLRRVVITGIGAVTPIGTAADGLWSGLEARTSAVRTVTRFDPTPFRSRMAAEIPDFRPQDHLDAKRARRLDRFSQLAVTSAGLALADAEIAPRKEDPDRVGAMMGSALGGVSFAESQVPRYLAEGPRGLDPSLALAVFCGAASCNIAIEFGFTGPNATNAMSCASGTIAVGEAFHVVRDGRADIMLAGGAEAPLAPLTFAAFSIIRAMSTRNDDPARASRPFDAARDGFVMGEGAAVLVLEERARALARGAKIYAEIVGYGFTNDAYHMTAPRPDGRQAARAMRLALADGHVDPTDVGYINAHGSSTPLNDATETAAIKQVFAEHAYRLTVSGTKGYYGHALGASGAIEAGRPAPPSQRRSPPPPTHLHRPRPPRGPGRPPGEGRGAAPDVVVSNSFGFGGVNATLVLRRA